MSETTPGLTEAEVAARVEAALAPARAAFSTFTDMVAHLDAWSEDEAMMRRLDAVHAALRSALDAPSTGPSIHLKNQITAAIGHMRRTPDFEWDHLITAKVLDVIAVHASCGFCAPAPVEPCDECESSGRNCLAHRKHANGGI